MKDPVPPAAAGGPVPFPRTVPELFRQFFGRSGTAHPFIQFCKYAAVGVFATLVNIATFSVFAWFVYPCITADDFVVKIFGLVPPAVDETARARLAAYCNVAGFVTSDVVCYLINRAFVFKPGKLPMWLEFLSFTAVSAFAAVLGAALQTWLIASFGAQTSVAFLVCILTALMFNYVLRKFFIFKG